MDSLTYRQWAIKRKPIALAVGEVTLVVPRTNHAVVYVVVTDTSLEL